LNYKNNIKKSGDIDKMQHQVKPKLYADVNKQMDQSYYNYEDY
jgi:hypothetical protein